METPILSELDYQAQSGDRLRRLIGILKLSNVDAAHIMGISKHVLNHWLVGNNPIKPYPLYRLCRAKGVDFNWVFLDDPLRLPYEVAKPLDEELQARLAATLAAESPAHEKVGG